MVLNFQGIPAAISLSGEVPSRDILREFASIGLVRSEYIFRDLELYPTDVQAGEGIRRYMKKLFAATTGPIAYRTMEVTLEEARSLRGFSSDSPLLANGMLGSRGVRHHQLHPASLHAELESLAKASEQLDRLTVVAPFVAAIDEYIWYRRQVEQVLGADVHVGTMLEIPSAAIEIRSFLDHGCRHFIVGANDMSSLLAGRPRASEERECVPGLARLLTTVVDAAHSVGAKVTVAGYLTPWIIDISRQAEVDELSIHYSHLPQFFDYSADELPELAHLQRVKEKTRRAILGRGE